MTGASAQSAWLATLSTPAKAEFLATLAWELTITARGTYEVQTEGLIRPSALRQINEIQHRVTAALRALLAGRSSPDFEWSLAHSLFEVQDPELCGETIAAWTRAKAWVDRPA